MRGPVDDAVPQNNAVVDEPEPPPRAPGGKALMRLLMLLDPKGYEQPAQTAIAAAVPEPQIEAFMESAQRYAPDPDDGARTASAPTRQRPDDPDAPSAMAEAPADEQLAHQYMDVAERLGPPTATGPQWRSLGPWTIPDGQTYGASRVNVSGRISAVVADPRNPAHLLIGAANGGVWESFDRGDSWAPRTDYAATLTVGALAFDPSDPRTVYCGTGEGNWWSWLGAGMLRSVDGGTTWSTLCTTPFVGQGFYDLVVDPGDSRRLVAGTTGGLYTSSDAGVTWTRRRAVRTWSLSLVRGTSGVEILAGCSDGVRRSTDGGVTWSAVSLPGSPASWDRLAVAIAPSRPTVAYAWGSSGGTARLYRRANRSWRAIGTPPGVATGQAWYDWFLAVSPDRHTQIYCGAIEVHRGDQSGSTWSWRNITNKGATGDSIHPDQHAMAFAPGAPDTIYVGNDGGLYRSPDRGVTWRHCNNGLVITEFEFLAHHPGSSRWLIGGTQDNGTQRWLGSPSWEHVADGDGGDVGVNRTTPQTVYHTYFNMTPERSTTGGGWGSWTFIPPTIPAGEGSLFYPPLECSASGGDTVAIGGGALYISRNNGGAWTRLAFPSGGTASALYLPDPNTAYVGLLDGRVLRTRFSGGAWGTLTALTTPRANAAVSDLFVDAAQSRLWATYSRAGQGRVFRSDDGGTSWTDCTTTGLPNLPLNAVAVDTANPARVWVAADLGVYQSTNAGASWTDFSSALPNAFVGDLLFHPHARVLRAGTRNRGVWEIPVDGWMTQPQCGLQFNGTLAANETRRWFTHSWPSTWHMIWTVMPTTPRAGGPQITHTVAVERASAEHVTYWITVRNLTPDPVAFEGRYCILSRY